MAILQQRKKAGPREEYVLDKIIQVIRKYLDPDQIILFGSRGKGTFRFNSDFDLAVDQKMPEFEIVSRIREEIDQVAGLYGVDVVYMKSVDPRLEHIIQKTGKVVYERGN